MGRANVVQVSSGGTAKFYRRFSATRGGGLNGDTVFIPAFDEVFPAGTVYIVVGMYVHQRETSLPTEPEEIDTPIRWSDSPKEYHIYINPGSGAVVGYAQGHANSRGDKYISRMGSPFQSVPYTVTINEDGTVRVLLPKDDAGSFYNGHDGYRYAEFSYCVLG